MRIEEKKRKISKSDSTGHTGSAKYVDFSGFSTNPLNFDSSV